MSANTELEYSGFNKRGKTQKGAEKTSLYLITAEDAENAEELALYLYIPRLPRFQRFIDVFNSNTP